MRVKMKLPLIAINITIKVKSALPSQSTSP